MIQSLPTPTKCLARIVWTWSDKGWQKLNTRNRYEKKTLKNCTKALPLVLMIQKSFKTKGFFWSNAVLLSPRKAKPPSTQEDWFFINTDSTGARYVCKATDELTKNRREDDEGFVGGLMYEKPGPNCPVVSFELYLSHLNPLNEFLFQRLKRNISVRLCPYMYLLCKLFACNACWDLVLPRFPLLSKLSCSSLQRQTSKPLSPVLQAIMLFKTQKKWLVHLSSLVLPLKLQCGLSPVKRPHYKRVQGELLSHLIDWTSRLICLALPGQFRRQLSHLCPSETVLCTIKSCEYLTVRFNSNSLCLQLNPGLRMEHCS